MLRLKQGVVQDLFNVNSALKLVLAFDENNVAEFFVAFEKITNKLVWPNPMWTTLLQCRLVGKARKVYVTLKEDLCSNYDSVKEIVMKAYTLVPEAYRQKFRELKKYPNQIYVKFARMKEQFLNEWLRSKNIGDFDGLRGLKHVLVRI